MSRIASVYARGARQVLFRLPAERAHAVGAAGLRVLGALPRRRAHSDPALRTSAFGLEFPTPIGLAAGFDKDAKLFAGALSLGFGFVEVGTVTAQPQPGNEPPRLARVPADRALVNRMGFNNGGVVAVAARLAARDRSRGIVGANIGKTKVTPLEGAADDYRASARAIAPVSDFLVVNVSSPNTPGLRSLQSAEALRPLLTAVLEEAAGRPVLLKVAPDLSDEELDEIADLAVELRLAGMIATNTTVDTSVLSVPLPLSSGGISGAPLKPRALAVLRRLHARTAGKLTLVAAGGIETAEDAWERIRAGATLVEVYTGFIYAGPAFPATLARELAALARANGFARVQDAVGSG